MDNYSAHGHYRPVTEVQVLAGVVVTYVWYCQQNRESTQIYANREPIHPRLAPLKSRGAGGSLGVSTKRLNHSNKRGCLLLLFPQQPARAPR